VLVQVDGLLKDRTALYAQGHVGSVFTRNAKRLLYRVSGGNEDNERRATQPTRRKNRLTPIAGLKNTLI